MISTLPNTLSVIRILLSPLFFVLFISDDPITRQISLGVFFIAALTDWYDGVIARMSGKETNLGKFLDPLADKILTSSAFVAFALLGMVGWWMVIIIIVRDMTITLLRSLAEAREAHIVTSKSAKWKTFIQMAVLYYLLAVTILRSVEWANAIMGNAFPYLLNSHLVFFLMLGVTLFTLFTGLQYLYDNRKFIGKLVGYYKRATS